MNTQVYLTILNAFVNPFTDEGLTPEYSQQNVTRQIQTQGKIKALFFLEIGLPENTYGR